MLDETLEKASVLGVSDIVISPVRYDWYTDGYKKHQLEGIRRFADKAAAKGVIHKNAADHKKAQLAKKQSVSE